MNRITPPVRTARLTASVRVLPAVGPLGPTVVLRFSPALPDARAGPDFRDFAQAVAKLGQLESPIKITRELH